MPISEHTATDSESRINESPDGPSKSPAMTYPKTGVYPKHENVNPAPIAHSTTDAIFVIVQSILSFQPNLTALNIVIVY